nr:unnamed protein product [Spirometra erinaceieuropaei]
MQETTAPSNRMHWSNRSRFVEDRFVHCQGRRLLWGCNLLLLHLSSQHAATTGSAKEDAPIVLQSIAATDSTIINVVSIRTCACCGHIFTSHNILISHLLVRRLCESRFQSTSISTQRRPSQTRSELSKAKRIVLKLGSAVVTNENQGGIALARVASIVEQIAELTKLGRECTLVTSGAVALGQGRVENSPKGAKAALGMTKLVGIYSQLFAHCGLESAALLLTPLDFENLERREYWRKALQDLLRRGIIPILNTNDAVKWKGELQEKATSLDGSISNTPPILLDNDALAARLASDIKADLLILGTRVNGVHTAPPGTPSAHALLEYDVSIDPYVHNAPSLITYGTCSVLGTGGMEAKVAAAEWSVRQARNIRLSL